MRKTPEPPSESRPSSPAAASPPTGSLPAPTASTPAPAGSAPAPGDPPAKAVSAYPGGSPGATTPPALPASSGYCRHDHGHPDDGYAGQGSRAPPGRQRRSEKRPLEAPTPGRGAVVVAAMALIIAAGAVLVALYSLNVAREAKSNAAAAASDADRLANPPRSSAAPAPTVTVTVTPRPSPTPTFLADLRAVELIIPPTQGCQAGYVDVDTGQVGNFTGHDFYFSACLGPLTVQLDNVDAGAATGGVISPNGCAALLTGVPPTPELQLPVASGTTFCLLTSKEAATRAGIPQHMAVVQVRQVASDRTVSVTLDTYRLAA